MVDITAVPRLRWRDEDSMRSAYINFCIVLVCVSYAWKARDPHSIRTTIFIFNMFFINPEPKVIKWEAESSQDTHILITHPDVEMD